MALTSIQRRNLIIYQRYRDVPMTIGGLCWASRQVYALMLILFGVAAALFYFAFGVLGAAFAGVAFVTVLLRDIGYFRRSAQTWPAIRKVIDWEKVAALVGEESKRET